MTSVVKTRVLTQLEQDVWDYIHIGRENRISRKALALKVGTTDRIVRQTIADLRQKGYAVMSMSDFQFNGYWIPSRKELMRDIEIYTKQAESRITEIQRSTRWVKMRKIKERIDVQD